MVKIARVMPLLVLILILSACGGPATAPAPTAEPTTAATVEAAAPSDGQNSGHDLEPSVAATPQPQPSQAPTTAPTEAPSDSQVQVSSLNDAEIQEARSQLEQYRGSMTELVFETFDRGNTTRGSWPENNSAILRDNFYRLRMDKQNSIRPNLWQPKGQPRALGTNYILEVDTAFDTGGAVGGVGLVFDAQDGDNYLSFLIFTDNTWQVFAFKDGKQFVEYSSRDFPTTAISGDRPNNLCVQRMSDGTILWINNTPVAAIEGSPFNGGFVGVSVYGGADVSSPISVIVDNFRVMSE